MIFFAFLILVPAIMILPDVLTIVNAGTDFYPFHLIGTPIKTLDFTFYSSIVQRVSESGWVFETQVYELAGNTLSREWLPFLIGGAFERIFGIYWEIIIKIFGTVAVFLSAWEIIGRWVQNNAKRTVLAGFFTFFPTVFGVLSISPLDFVAKTWTFLGSSVLFLNRFHSPVTTLPFFLLAIYFALNAFEKNDKKQSVIAGVAAGLLFYTYFYYIAFFFGILALLIFEALKNKKFALPEKTAIMIGSAFIVGLPYFIVMAVNAFSGISADMVLRLGLAEVSRPYYYLPTIKYLLLVAAAFLVSKKASAEKVFFAGIILAGIIGMNIQIVTGINLQFIHWQQQVVDPVAFLLVLALAREWLNGKLKIPAYSTRLKLNPELLNYAWTIAAVFVLVFAVNVQSKEFMKKCDSASIFGGCEPYKISKGEKEAFEWLKNSAAKDDVVLALSAETNARISADTGLYVFYPNGFLTTASNSEIEKRMGFAYKFYGVDEETFSYLLTPEAETLPVHKVTQPIENEHDRLLAEKSLLANYPFHFLYHATGLWQEKKFNNALSGWSDEIQSKIRKAGYEGNNFFYPKGTADRIINEYLNSDSTSPSGKLDFIWVGAYERQIGKMTGFEKFLEKKFDNGEIQIYRFIAQ